MPGQDEADRLSLARRRLVGALTLALVASTPAAAERPGRIVSLNLCADQYLLALADREQIAALTVYAVDPEMSALADEAAGLPIIRGAAEEVIRLDPDLVIGGRYTRRETRELLRRLDYRVVEIDAARSLEDVRATTRAVANLVGHRERGERLVEDLDRRIAASARRAGAHAPSALYYQRRGFANGAESLVSEIMAAVGLRNLARDLGLRRTGRVELERIVAARPDYLILDTLTPRVDDQGTHLLEHPALLASVPAARRLSLPQRLVVCGGPMTIGAIDHLTRAVAVAAPRP